MKGCCMSRVRSNHSHFVVPTDRLSLDELNKMDDKHFFAYLDARIRQSGKKLWSKELEELSQSFVKRAEENEKKYIGKINAALTRLEKSKARRASNSIYILRFLLKNMLDAESQEEFLLYFRSFNDIAEDLQQNINRQFEVKFWKSLSGLMDTRFVFIRSEKEDEKRSYKKIGKILINAVISLPVAHSLFSMFSWWLTGLMTATGFIDVKPFEPPPVSLKEKITCFIARHTKKIIAVSIALAIVGAVAPFAFPFMAPLIVPIVTMASDIMAVGGLMSAGVSALIFWHEARLRTRRIAERLDLAASEINKALKLGDVSKAAKSTLAYVIEQLSVSDKPNRKKMEVPLKHQPKAEVILYPKTEVRHAPTVCYSPAPAGSFTVPRRRM